VTALLARYCLQGPFGLRRKTDELELSYDGDKQIYKVDKFDDFTAGWGKCSAKQEVTVSQVCFAHQLLLRRGACYVQTPLQARGQLGIPMVSTARELLS
jgi:hypothetical protein